MDTDVGGAWFGQHTGKCYAGSSDQGSYERQYKGCLLRGSDAGQSPEPEENIRNREADTELKRARKQAVTGENETDEALDKLDQILKEVRDNAIKQETE